jgi:hypothetical protein
MGVDGLVVSVMVFEEVVVVVVRLRVFRWGCEFLVVAVSVSVDPDVDTMRSVLTWLSFDLQVEKVQQHPEIG